MFAKSDVNGKNENPIYTFLKSRCPSVRKEFQAPYKLYYDLCLELRDGPAEHGPAQQVQQAGEENEAGRLHPQPSRHRLRLRHRPGHGKGYL